MTEWEIHEKLERLCFKKPLFFHQKKLFLLASEVMPDVWGINDPNGYWASPSTDFIFLGEDGTLWIAELKNKCDGIRDAWSVFCQISYSEYLFQENRFSSETIPLLSRRYLANIAERFSIDEQQQFETEIKNSMPTFNGSTHCLIIAASIKRWSTVANFVQQSTFGEIKQHLETNYQIETRGNLSMKRFCAMRKENTEKLRMPSILLLSDLAV